MSGVSVMRGESEAFEAGPLPRLAGVWLRVARVGWGVLALAALSVLIASLPGYGLKFLGRLAHLPVENPSLGIRIITAGSAVASLASALLSMGLSFMLFRRRFTDPAAAVLSFYLLLYGVLMAGPIEHMGVYWTGDASFAWSLQAYLLAAPTVALFALFPDGQIVPRWMRWVVATSIPMTILTMFLVPMGSGDPFPGSVSTAVLSVGYVSLYLAAIIAQVGRYRRHSTPRQREQTKVVVFAFGVWFAYILLSSIPFFYLNSLPVGSELPWWGPMSELGWWLSLNIIPVALTVSITRYRLWDIDLIINRTLVYGALTACVIVLYLFVIGAFGYLFQSRDNLLLSLLATGTAAVLFQPLRGRLQAAVNRLMYGERDDPAAVLSRLGRQLEWTGTPEENLGGIVETVAQAMKLPYVAIELENGERPRVEYGVPRDHMHAFPLVFHGEAVGRLLVCSRDQADSLSQKDRALLEVIARHAGPVAHNAQLTADLLIARQRLVTSREEERRRLRRDLHDGLGPRLASLALRLDAAGNLLGEEEGESRELLNESKAQVQHALGDIRRLVHNLRPPALDELGLAAALRQEAESISAASPTQVAVEVADPLPPLSAALEVAAYRIVLEAVNNAVQHAEANRCRVQLRVGQGLTIQVWDDGKGIPAKLRIGVGITSMRERAEELGGRFEISKDPEGGTVVRARLPLPSAGE